MQMSNLGWRPWTGLEIMWNIYILSLLVVRLTKSRFVMCFFCYKLQVIKSRLSIELELNKFQIALNILVQKMTLKTIRNFQWKYMVKNDVENQLFLKFNVYKYLTFTNTWSIIIVIFVATISIIIIAIIIIIVFIIVIDTSSILRTKDGNSISLAN